jgi:hypothetical protein
MKTVKKLEFDKSGYDKYKSQILKIGEILIDAKNELQKLEVKSQLKDLTNGNFLDEFHNYHKKAHAQEKDSFAQRLPYEKYIEMLGFDLSKIEELEQNYKASAFSSREFYAYNHWFYVYCKNNVKRNSNLKEHLENAPKKVLLKPVDLFVFKRNKIEVDLDEDLFTTYATTPKQSEMISNIEQLVTLCRKIGFGYKDVYPLVKDYLIAKNGHSIPPWPD